MQTLANRTLRSCTLVGAIRASLLLAATVNQLDRSAALNGGNDIGQRLFLLVRVKALAPGTTGR